jgi:hypothetical protein
MELSYLMAHELTPLTVQLVPHLAHDMRDLAQLLSQETPPSVMLWAKSIFLINYGFGDTSSKGFGSTFALKDGISYQISIWKPDQNDKSSNWR